MNNPTSGSVSHSQREPKARIVISGGGTGGHIYPAIGIANALRRLQPEVDIVFIGGGDRLESTIVPQHGFRFLPISVAGFPRKLTWRWIPVIWKVCTGVVRALWLLKKLKPGVVIGTGGYVSGPVLFAAVILGIPTVVQEQNVSPGITNRLLARWAKIAYVAFEATVPHFPADKAKVTGNPIRAEITQYEDKRLDAYYAELGLDANLKTVFVMGGSQGAHAINQIMMEALNQLESYCQKLQIVHQTGRADYKTLKERADASPLRYVVEPYFDAIESVYRIADLMVCRAGGMTISEITACGVPAIFIPLPSSVGNDQKLNAQAVADRGAAVVLDQHTLTGSELAEKIAQIITAPEKWQRMADATRELGKPHASEDIARSVYSFLKSQD